MMYKYQGIEFDDYVYDSEYEHTWSHICNSCVVKHSISEALLDDIPSSDVTCGVNGCQNEADYYIDFPDENNE